MTDPIHWELLERWARGACDEEERERLESWMAARPGHRQLALAFRRTLEQPAELTQRFDVAAASARLESLMFRPDPPPGSTCPRPQVSSSDAGANGLPRPRRKGSIAAAIVIAIAGAGVLLCVTHVLQCGEIERAIGRAMHGPEPSVDLRQ